MPPPRLFFCALVALAGACPSSTYRPPPILDAPLEVHGPPAWGENALEVGIIGQSGFEPLAGSTSLHSGSQGGFHLPITVRVINHSSDSQLVTFSLRALRSSDQLLVSRTSNTEAVDAPDGGTWLSREATLFFCPTSSGVDLDGQEVDIEIIASIEAQLMTSATVKTVLVCDSSSCSSLCKG